MCDPIRFVECNQKCNDPYITSNTPSCLIPELTDCSTPVNHNRGTARAATHRGGGGDYRRKKSQVYDNDSIISFKTMLLNLKNITTSGETNNVITIDIRKKNNMVLLQWEPFMATTAIEQASNFSIAQGLRDMPPHSVTQPFLIKVGSNWVWSTILIDPFGGTQIKFFYGANMTSVTNINTAIEVPGGNMQWISDR